MAREREGKRGERTAKTMPANTKGSGSVLRLMGIALNQYIGWH